VEFTGNIRESKEADLSWRIEVSSLCIFAYGGTRKEVFERLHDLIITSLELHFKENLQKGFKLDIIDHGDGTVGVEGSDQKVLMALALRKQRERKGSSVRQVSGKMGSSSPAAYARYEKGEISMSLEKFDQLLKAIDSKHTLFLTIH